MTLGDKDETSEQHGDEQATNETKTTSSTKETIAGTAFPKAEVRRESGWQPARSEFCPGSSVQGPCAGKKIWGAMLAAPMHEMTPAVLAMPGRRQARHTQRAETSVMCPKQHTQTINTHSRWIWEDEPR
ncbi:hypothetical protein B0H11DRAFT_1914799 [Mycena galericulata]|nr:hypothetical protein B0H11DRAFT_1914799 [Mycena galericulata]